MQIFVPVVCDRMGLVEGGPDAKGQTDWNDQVEVDEQRLTGVQREKATSLSVFHMVWLQPSFSEMSLLAGAI